MEEAHPQSERRSQARYAVDTEASLVMVNPGAAWRARMLELSVDGCRVRTDRHSTMAMPTGVEVAFQINGIAFRLAGTMQWLDSQLTAGIHFSPMTPRRSEALLDLLGELEAKRQAQENSETHAPAAAEEEKPAGGAKLAKVAPEPRTKAVVPFMPPRKSEKESSTPAPSRQSRRRDRRDEARLAVDTRATVFFIDVRAQISGRILDLSMSGCRIHTDERFPVGIYRRVETEFKADGLPFRLVGVVQAMHDKFTVGIRFLDMSSRKRDQLTQLMEEMKGQ